MDILAARKKAAEQAGAANKPAPEAATPAAQRAPEQPATEQAAPEQASPEKATPEQAAPEQASPEKATPEQAAPGQASPEQATQEQEAPEQETPPAPPGSGSAPPAPPAAGVAPPSKAPLDATAHVPASSTVDRDKTPQQEEIELLSFRLGGEEYAVLVEDVREVLKNYQLTIVPNTPDYILGVMSLRGTMLPIIDLCKRFGLATAAIDEKSRIVVASSADEEAGLRVDRVTGVFRILPDEIKPVPENIEQGAEFLRGIVRTADRLYILLDLEKALGV